MHDVIVVGGGPAGMTAALYALRNGKSALVIEKAGFGGQITHSPKVENYPGTLSASGNEIADGMFDQIMAQGADIEVETVCEIRDEGGVKRVITEEGTEHEGRAVVIATGVKHRMLGLPGEEDLVGEGISFCAVCDGDFYAGQTVAVAGGGNSALQEATLLSETCKKVILVQNLPTLTGEKRLADALLAKENVEAVYNSTVTGFDSENGAVTGVRIHNSATGEDSALAVEGVFVAGDCRTKSVRQITTATADGATAALAAGAYAP